MKDEIKKMLNQGSFAKLQDEIIKLNVVDIANLIEEFEGDQVLMLFRLLPKEYAADVFTYFTYEQQQYIIEGITDREIQSIIGNLFFDDTVDLLEEMPANVVKKIINNTGEGKRNLINQFLKYPENSAGSLMTIEYIDLKREITI